MPHAQQQWQPKVDWVGCQQGATNSARPAYDRNPKVAHQHFSCNIDNHNTPTNLSIALSWHTA